MNTLLTMGLSALVLVGVAGFARPLQAAPPTSSPLPIVQPPPLPERVPFYSSMVGSDRKLVLHAFDLLWNAAQEQDWDSVRRQLRTLLASRLVAGPWDSHAAAGLAYCYLFSAYVPEFRDGQLTGPELTQFQRWLLAHPDLTRRFVFAISDSDNPGAATGIVHALCTLEPEKSLRFPDLVTAMAIVFDRGRQSTTQVQDTFRWLTDSRLSQAWDAQQLPHELSRYLVDVHLSRQDRIWAYLRYPVQINLESIYLDLEYDHNALAGKRPKRIEGHDYTLPNLLAYGGTCVEQSYYASQIGRTLGFPVAIIQHSAPGTIGHRWCLQLAAGAGGYRWYEVGGRGFGRIEDPATGRKGSGQSLGFLLQSLTHPQTDRQIASALTQIALRVPDWARIDLLAGPNPLRILTETKYDPSASPAYYAMKRKLQPLWILLAALQADPYHATTWAAIEDLGATGSLTADEVASLYERLALLTGRRYPDVLYRALTALHLKLPPDQEVQFIEAAAATLTNEQLHRAPEMLGNLMIQAGEVRAAQGRDREALDRFEQAIALDDRDVATVVRAVELAWPLAERFDRSELLDAAIGVIFDKSRSPAFGLAIGEIAARAGRREKAVEWLRYVFDRTQVNAPGRYDVLRAAVEVLAEMQEYEVAIQWEHELYGMTLHPNDGRRLAELLSAAGRREEAAQVLLAVEQLEQQRQRQIEAQAGR